MPTVHSGEIFATPSGGKTTPAPTLDFTTDRKATNSIKRLNKWLHENAKVEAGKRGLLYYDSGPPARGDWPQASVDQANMILFNEF